MKVLIALIVAAALGLYVGNITASDYPVGQARIKDKDRFTEIAEIQSETFTRTGKFVQSLEDGSVPEWSPKPNKKLPDGFVVNTYSSPKGVGYEVIYRSDPVPQITATSS